jgi:hypothetical protein
LPQNQPAIAQNPHDSDQALCFQAIYILLPDRDLSREPDIFGMVCEWLLGTIHGPQRISANLGNAPIACATSPWPHIAFTVTVNHHLDWQAHRLFIASPIAGRRPQLPASHRHSTSAPTHVTGVQHARLVSHFRNRISLLASYFAYHYQLSHDPRYWVQAQCIYYIDHRLQQTYTSSY